MARIRWPDRRFDFSFPTEIYPEILERLRGTPARITERLTEVAPSLLSTRFGGHWSLLENAGHLADLDQSLFLVRLDEYERGVDALSPADMTNQRTEQANHNGKTLETVLQHARRSRAHLVARLEALDEAIFARPAFHPRLKLQMRLVDLMFFQAEHDDHHLATMTEIIRNGMSLA